MATELRHGIKMTTNSFDALEGPVPEVGEDLVVEVIPSQTRTTLFPDLVNVFGRGTDAIELILLRQEVSLRSQKGTVTATTDDSLMLDFKPNVVRTELYDIGHMRISVDLAADLGLALVAHAINIGGKDQTAMMKRLQSAVVKST